MEYYVETKTEMDFYVLKWNSPQEIVSWKQQCAEQQVLYVNICFKEGKKGIVLQKQTRNQHDVSGEGEMEPGTSPQGKEGDFLFYLLK